LANRNETAKSLMERISKGRRDLRKEMQREEDVNNL
jgi:hypothetical protein